MKPIPFFLTISSVAILTVACEKKPEVVIVEERPMEVTPEPATKTFETKRLGMEIDRYEKEPSAGNSAAVKKAFAELDGEIAELNERVAKTSGDERDEAAQKAANLTAYRAGEEARFIKATALHTTPNRTDASTAADKIENTARKAGEGVEDAAKKIGEGLKDAADSVRDAVK